MSSAVAPLRALWLALALLPPAHGQVDWTTDDDQALPESALLAIGVAPIEPLPVDPESGSAEEAVLNQAEARYLAHGLRAVLERSRAWGPARLLPGPDPSTELLIRGRVIESTSERLLLDIEARDATGRVWLAQSFQGNLEFDGPASQDGPLFLPLFRAVAEDLAAFRRTLSLEDLSRIIEVSRMRYGARLLPSVYGEYLNRDADGSVRLRRLPAEDDPLMTRVERVREAEYLFIDAVDRTLGQHVVDFAPTYVAWRRARQQSAAIMDDYRRSSSRNRGRDRRLTQVYNEFREVKLYQDSLRRDLAAFAFEVGPTRLELDGELVELTGSLDSQQEQWRSLLQRIHLEAVGLPP